MSRRLVALTTTPSLEVGEHIAGRLVERRLAACVNVLPAAQSFYEWKGALHSEPECLLVIKTSAARFAALRTALVELHPYELPELVALEIAAGHAPYLAWLDAGTRPRPSRRVSPRRRKRRAAAGRRARAAPRKAR